MLKWIIRICCGVLALALLTVVVGGISFSIWRQDQLRELEAGSEVIQTARGEIEYAAVGEGIPFLSLHGNPGGYDQILAGPRAYPNYYTDRKLIAVSRPGYLRTPLSSGKTFEEQADLFAALLDELGIEKVFVYGTSGGGYPALQFAMRHPERCLGLILLAASVNYEPLPEGDYREAMRDIPVPNVLAWALEGALFDAVAQSFIPDLDTDNEADVLMARDILQSVLFPFEARLPGIRNDSLQRDFPEIDSWPLERIVVPTLLLHGDMDENSVYEGSLHVLSKVPNAELVTFKGGDHHIILTRFGDINEEVSRFVDQVMTEIPK